MRNEQLTAIFGDDESHPIFAPMEEHLLALTIDAMTPVVAVGACLMRIEQAGPPLREVLAIVADGEFSPDDDLTLAFRGLHILAGARDEQAFPILVRLLRRPNVELEHLLGDAITETLPRIIAGLFDGDTEALFGLIEDRALDEYVRDGAWGAATFLTWEGRIERDELRALIERFDVERLAEDGEYVWVGWLEAIAHLGMRDLAPLVEAAFRDGRVVAADTLELSDFEEDLSNAERAPGDIERFKQAHLGLIDDVYDELTRWDSFDDFHDEGPVEPVINPMRRVGRNDPCPCGSGKKAKKCCLAA